MRGARGDVRSCCRLVPTGALRRASTALRRRRAGRRPGPARGPRGAPPRRLPGPPFTRQRPVRAVAVPAPAHRRRLGRRQAGSPACGGDLGNGGLSSPPPTQRSIAAGLRPGWNRSGTGVLQLRSQSGLLNSEYRKGSAGPLPAGRFPGGPPGPGRMSAGRCVLQCARGRPASEGRADPHSRPCQQGPADGSSAGPAPAAELLSAVGCRLSAALYFRRGIPRSAPHSGAGDRRFASVGPRPPNSARKPGVRLWRYRPQRAYPRQWAALSRHSAPRPCGGPRLGTETPPRHTPSGAPDLVPWRCVQPASGAAADRLYRFGRRRTTTPVPHRPPPDPAAAPTIGRPVGWTARRGRTTRGTAAVIHLSHNRRSRGGGTSRVTPSPVRPAGVAAGEPAAVCRAAPTGYVRTAPRAGSGQACSASMVRSRRNSAGRLPHTAATGRPPRRSTAENSSAPMSPSTSALSAAPGWPATCTVVPY